MKKVFLIGTVALVAAAAGVWLALSMHVDLAPGLPTSAVPEYRPEFALPDLDGTLRAFSEWDGQLTIVNFWATWCAPCRREIPVLIELHASQAGALTVLGIAIDDMDAVRDYVAEMGFNYPTLVGQLDAINISRAFGNHIGALPFTVIVGADGRILWTHAGEVTAAMLDEALAGL